MENIKFDTSALRSRIISEYGTIKAFAAAVNMSPSTLGSRLNGHIEFDFDEMQRISKQLNLTCEEVDWYFFTEQRKAHSIMKLAEAFLKMSGSNSP